MRLNRLVAGVATAGLLGITPVALAAPAGAATENRTVTITLESGSANPVAFGEEASLSGKVLDAVDGTSVYKGTVTLWAMSSKNPTWTPVATDEASGYLSFYDLKPKSNSAYKLTYSGYTATSTYENNYAIAESLPVAVGVQRVVKLSTNKLTIKGKIKPKYKKKKVVIKTVKGKKLKNFRKLKTNKKSQFSFRAPRKGGFKFVVSIPGDKHYVSWTSTPYVVNIW